MTKSVHSLKDDPNFGVDSRWSWITACFCGVVLFMGTATTRIAGIFFYGIIETFGVNREEASWPVSLAGTMLLLGGPIVGVLCRRFSCRPVLLTCSLVTGATVCACYLAPNVVFITIVFGILHGIAMSGLYVATNVLVAQHFEKRRTTACSLLFTASGLNTAALSPLVEYFRTTYGIRGAFLLYGAVLLNAFPAAIPLRSPEWLKKAAKPSQKKETPVQNQTKAAIAPTRSHCQRTGRRRWAKGVSDSRHRQRTRLFLLLNKLSLSLPSCQLGSGRQTSQF
ncbi:monocarboxylate transporter 4-like isoform X2 [Haemaphysalis longicornis]